MKILMKTLLATAFVATALSGARADQLDDIKSRGSLVCATMGTMQPFSFQDPKTRQIVGYEVDLCKAIADDMGVKLEIKTVSTEARIPELTQGRVDILSAALGYTDERATQINYSQTSFVSRQMVMVKKDSGLKTLDDLSGKRVSAPKGTSSEALSTKVLSNATILTFQDPPSAFLALQQSKVNAMALSELGMMPLIAKTGNKYEIVAQPLAIEFWGLGVRKDEDRFLSEVNKVLTKLEETGEGEKIFARWFGEPPFNIKKNFKFTSKAGNPELRPAQY